MLIVHPLFTVTCTQRIFFLTSTLTAKIGDFVSSSMPRKSSSPFSPLAITSDHPTPSLDVFAFGCVVCHVITQQLPVPIGISLNEVQLRQYYIDQIKLEPLKQLVITSLYNNSEDRPLISQVCERMNSIMGKTIREELQDELELHVYERMNSLIGNTIMCKFNIHT